MQKDDSLVRRGTRYTLYGLGMALSFSESCGRGSSASSSSRAKSAVCTPLDSLSMACAAAVVILTS